MSRRVHYAQVIGDASGASASASGSLPLPPSVQRPATLFGPDVWWNPLSPSWPPTAAGRAVTDAARQKAAEAGAAVDAAVADAKTAVAGIDPILVAEAMIGKPTWGYYVPTVAIGVASTAALGVIGYLAYKKANGRK